MTKVQKFFTIFLFSIFYLLLANHCQAAILYLEPENGNYQINDTFIVNIRIDTEGECINTVKTQVNFPSQSLKIIDFSQGNSFLVVWLEPPKINQDSRTLSFIGGIPGGYCGRLPGDPDETNLLGKIIIQAKEIGESLIFFSTDSQILLNDGLATPAELAFKEAIFAISSKESGELKNEWQEELMMDKIPPEPFEAEIVKDPEIFEGKYFIVFHTTDKQTGVDYYEIKEGDRASKKINSPYLLEDQSLKSIIEIKAVDKAGHERIIKILPQIAPTEQESSPVFIFLILLLATVIISWWLIKKRRIK